MALVCVYVWSIEKDTRTIFLSLYPPLFQTLTPFQGVTCHRSVSVDASVVDERTENTNVDVDIPGSGFW